MVLNMNSKSTAPLIRLANMLAIVTLISACAVKQPRITSDEALEIYNQDQNLLSEGQELLTSPLDLHQSMARAVKYNLEHRVRLIEEAAANLSYELAKNDLLPKLSASYNLTDRNNVNASSSESVITGAQSLEPSTSQESNRNISELKIAWNILDFGINYHSAKQELDRSYIAGASRKKVMLSLLQQVRHSYWKARAMTQVQTQITKLKKQADIALKQLDKVEGEQLRPPIQVLNDKRALLTLLQKLDSLYSQSKSAQIEFSKILNLPPGTELLFADSENVELPVVSRNIDQFEKLAIQNSPDILSQIYNTRIEHTESRKDMLRMLPGIEFSYGNHYDSNKFLLNNDWREAALRVNWNLLNVFSYNEVKERSMTRNELAIARRQAISAAVITQVHLSWQAFQNTNQSLDYATRLNSIDQRISTLARQAKASQASSGAQSLQRDVQALQSQMSALIAHAEAQGSYGTLLTSLGLNPVPENYQQLSVTELADTLRSNWQTAEQCLETPDEC